jgi:hypothetical protein
VIELGSMLLEQRFGVGKWKLVQGQREVIVRQIERALSRWCGPRGGLIVVHHHRGNVIEGGGVARGLLGLAGDQVKLQCGLRCGGGLDLP